jgi:hypothetical protein
VVELSDQAGQRRVAHLPNVYVGETGLSPERRFEQHRRGGRTASAKVAKYGIKLRPDLYSHLPPFATEAESVAAESALRLELEMRGFRVWGGTRGLSQGLNRNLGA